MRASMLPQTVTCAQHTLKYLVGDRQVLSASNQRASMTSKVRLSHMLTLRELHRTAWLPQSDSVDRTGSRLSMLAKSWRLHTRLTCNCRRKSWRRTRRLKP